MREIVRGKFKATPKRFPHGMKALAKYVSSHTVQALYETDFECCFMTPGLSKAIRCHV